MIVVDSSVAFKWLVPEDDSAAAEALIGHDLVAPDLLLLECGNALWKRVLRRQVPPATISSSLALIGQLVSLVETRPLIDRALAIAVGIEHPVYDCVFLALAEERQAPFVTADAKLIDKVRQSSPSISICALRDWRPT